MEKFNKKIVIIVFIVIIVGIFIYYFILQRGEEEYNLEINEIYSNIEENEQEEAKTMVIHITGEIKNEGIIELEEGARIADAIEKAGGTTNDADISKVNLAYVLNDGQKIYIPSIYDEEISYIEEDAGNNVIVENSKNSKTALININTATQTELETLSGIGPSSALKIIKYREQNGKFNKIEDIMNVSGIGEAKFSAIKDYICVN